MIDFARLEEAWRSSANNPAAAANAYLMQDLAATLKQRRDNVRGPMVLAGAALGINLALFTYSLITGRGDPIDWSREWAVVPFFAIPVVVLGLIWRRYQAHVKRHPDIRAALPEVFRALLDENAFARLRIKIIALAYVVVIPVLVWLIVQLGDVGKMEPRHQQQMGIVFGAILSVGAAYMAFKYFSQLVPERRRLEALLGQYHETEG